MSVIASKTVFGTATKTLTAVFVYIAVALFTDSIYVSEIYEHSQYITIFILISGWIFLYLRVNPRTKELMINAVVIGLIGEIVLSLVLGMYTYRLGSIPLYVPPGHAIVYVSVLYFTKAAVVRKNTKYLEYFFYAFIAAYSLCFLFFKNDIFGFVMTLISLFFLRTKPRERFFYLAMYFTVAYLELVGTSFGCWKWPSIAFGVFDSLPSMNPPTGISLGYFILDFLCIWVYSLRHKTAWKRTKRMRELVRD